MDPTADSFQRAVNCFQNGQYAEAERLCRALLVCDRRHYSALHLLGLVALQRGDAGGAVDFFRRSLGINPAQPAVQLNLANAQLRLRQPEAALASCDAALLLRSGDADAMNNRGTALLGLNRAADALSSYEQALRLKPDAAVYHCNRGRALRDLDRLQESLASFQRALELQPGLAEASIGLAETLRDLGRAQEAVDSLDRALAMHPGSVALLLSRGNLWFQLGCVEAALADYTRVLQIAPDDADAAYNQGNALLRLKRLEQAVASYDTAIRLRPHFAKAHYYRGETLRKLRRSEESLASYSRALAISPADAEAASGLGNALRELDRFGEALEHYDRALKLDPRCIDALSNRGRVLLALNRPAEAGACLARLFELAPDIAPDYNYALGMMLHARLLCCDWSDYDSMRDSLLAGVLAGKRVCLPSQLLAISDSPQVQLACARLFVEDNWVGISAAHGPCGPYRHRRVRLAYVSADFREHPVSMAMVRTFETHDREQFEIYAISLRPEHASDLGRRVKAAFDAFIDVTGKSDLAIARTMRELEIDVAVDLNGYTDGFRPGIFAHRAAPIQVNYLGYAGTSAAPYMDYLIADRIVIPDLDRRFYTEKVAHLPDCFLPLDPTRVLSERGQSRREAGLPEGAFIFCCFNNQYKIRPSIFDLYMRLLRSVESSVLWLPMRTDLVTHNLRREAERRGVAPERLVFAPRMANLSDHLARYRIADLFLDTLPFNAHSTAGDALWAGLPVLTCPGAAFAGRVAASLVAAAGLPELVTRDLAEYEAAAIKLASNPAQLAELKARLARHRESAPLFDHLRHRRHLEAAYLLMLRRYEHGDPAESFAVPPLSVLQ